MDFKTKYSNYLEIIENELKKKFNDDFLPEKTLNDGMKYSLLAGGKRIRPVLVLAVTDVFKGDKNLVLPLACSIEMIHTYSLIHDDLPAMDNDDIRRGKATLHKKYDEAIAILAGDGLLNLAIEVSLDNDYLDDNNWSLYHRALKNLFKASGSKGMIAGQIIDMESENKNIDIDILKYMHKKKTGEILKAAIMISADLFCNNPVEYKSLEFYAEKIGLAFQIKDDILDVEGDTKVLGKPKGSDENKNKSTFVSIYGLERAKNLLKENIEEGISRIKSCDLNTEFLVEIAKYILHRRA
ncbi:MAG: polyprenyl synthetase family protein [Clostridiales bacterium]